MKCFIKVLLLSVSLSSFLGASDPSSVRAKARLGKIAGQVRPAPVGQLQPEGVAATADFLQQPEYCSRIMRKWEKYLVWFGDTIIKQLLENEERYKQDYFVFYHAQMADNRLVVEFLKNLYEFENKKQLRGDFEFLRFWQDGSDYADVNSYLDSFGIPNPFVGGGKGLSDSREDIREVLLAVNPVLFGNFDWDGECTFEYFLRSRNIQGFLDAALKKLFSRYSFDVRFIPSLFAVNTAFETDTGDIVQIFIPKHLVNDCAYLCGGWGVPTREYIVNKNNKPLALDNYDDTRKRYAQCSGILNIMQNDIGAIHNAQKIQLRLFFAKSGPLLNPDLGVKVFRFTTLTVQQMKDYKQQVYEISQQIFAGSSIISADRPLGISSPFESPRSLTPQQAGEVEKAIALLPKKLANPRTLFEAVEQRDAIPWVQKLLQEGADINARDSHGNTPLMRAIVTGASLDTVQFLVRHGADIEIKDNNGYTPLLAAALLGKFGMVRFFIDQGADRSVVSKRGDTVLISAVKSGSLQIVQFLVDLGVDIERANAEGQTALTEAALRGLKNIVAYLFTHGANIEYINRVTGKTVLMEVSSQGSIDMVTYLVENGADVNTLGTADRTALMWAAENGREDVVHYLVEHGADMALRDKFGRTAFSMARDPGIAAYLKREYGKNRKPLTLRQRVIKNIKSKL